MPTVFGSYTSASRKAVLPVFEKRNNLYFYPTYYEGFECSKNVVYTGAVPNQQLSEFHPLDHQERSARRSSSSSARTTSTRAKWPRSRKILIEKNGGEWVADEYLELGHSEWGSMVNKIKESGCDVVLSNVVGDSVVAFYREYKNQGLTHDKLPICATVTSEIEIAAMGAGISPSAASPRSPISRRSTPTSTRRSSSAIATFVKDPKAVTHHALESRPTSRSSCGSRRSRRPAR